MWALIMHCRSYSYVSTPETQFSEIPHLMNKLQLSFSNFTLYSLNSVNRLNLVNKKGLTTTFTKSSLGCTRKRGINKINTSSAVQRPRGYLIVKASGRFSLLLHMYIHYLVAS